MIQYQYHPMLLKKYAVTPLARIFYRNFLIEAGSSTDGGMMLNFMSFTANAKDINAQEITKKFKALPEVENVDVNLGKKIVSLKTKDGKDLTDKVITDILTESGYNVEKIER